MGKQTAEQLTEGFDASALTIIVTGGTNGLGKETVRVLAKRGAHVYLAARNLTAAEKVKEGIVKETPRAKVDFLKIDLASLESVRTAANEFLALNVPLNVLVCNAGMAATTLDFSVDGVELDFATNYLGHFLLTHLLLEKLKVTATESGIEGRIVSVSSAAHEIVVREGGVQFDAICRSDKTKGEGTKLGFMPLMKNYGQSKLAQILFTKELAKHLQDEGVNNVTVNCLHPGIVKTNFAENGSTLLNSILSLLFTLCGSSVAQGAALQTYLAMSPEVKGVTGRYFVKGKEYPLKSKYAINEELQKKLWDFSMKLISA